MKIAEIAILWDMDGTLIDTLSCHFTAWQDTLLEHGIKLDGEVYYANFGRNTNTILPILLGFTPDEPQAVRLIEEKERRFRQNVLHQASLISGVRVWLGKANDLHIPQVIASSSTQENIEFLISRFNISSYFSAFISGADLPAKPEPDVFMKAAQILNRKPENCLVIEDSLAGVQAAKAAGMRCIAVTTSQPQSALTEADLVVANFNFPFEEMLVQLDIH